MVSSFNVVYDHSADVLYVIKKDTPAVRGVEDRQGIVWRYDARGELIGATIVDFYDHWYRQRLLLTEKLSERFHIPQVQASVVLDHALDEVNR